MSDKVWYAVYGTNLNEQRFSCYIEGGIPEGTSKADPGCRDKTPALDGGKIAIPFQLYFSQKSSKWKDRSVGFLGLLADQTIQTLGRKYLVTLEQFEDIFRQENDLGGEKELFLNIKEVQREGAITFRKSWYGRIIYLGMADEAPIFTLTCFWNFKTQKPLPPSVDYLRHIISGIRQTYNFSDDQIV